MAKARKKLIRQQPPLPAPAGAAAGDERWLVAGLCLVLAAITFAVFGQTLHHEFINFDDDDYVYNNPMVARGLTLKGIVWAFSCHADNWHPLTWLSHMLDCQLCGLHPGGHHLTNVLLHTATVIVLFLVLRQMTGALWRSAFVSAVFAIHPLRVESVAWVAERKDVLSGLFFMLTLGAYVRYARRPWSPACYGLVMLLFALGLMCKPMLVTLPLVLLLLDYWPLQRKEASGRLVMEKLPLLALSAASCMVTFLAQHEAIQTTATFPLPLRLANALESCMIYLGQMVFPSGLALFYPYTSNSLPPWEVALAGALLTGLSTVALWQWRKQPWVLVGWLWYLVMLLPVAGIIQVGDQAHADRYTYLPQIGLYVAATWLVSGWGAKWHARRVGFTVLMTFALAVLMVCAWKQTAYWKNSETLWTRSLACTTHNAKAHYNLGITFLQKGKPAEAIIHFQQALQKQALQITPGLAEVHDGLGNALLQKGSVDEAIVHFQQALQIAPDNATAHYNLGVALLQKGRADEAITHFQQTLQIKPGLAEVYNGLGNALLQKGSVDEAITQFQAALQIEPGSAEVHNSLGNALLQKGRADDAIAHFQQALQIKPDYAAAHYNLGNALLQKGRADEAITQFQADLKIEPDAAEVYNSLGNALLQKGRPAEAIRHYQTALQIDPTNPEVENDLAWVLATCAEASLRNGNKAVELARQANELAGGESPIFLHTLAAAFAEAGQFSEAMHTAQKAMELAQAAGQQDLAAQLNDELKRYGAGLPLHQ